MNEWPPGGSYSSPGTPNPAGRSFRSQYEEPEKGTKPLIVNNKGVSDNKGRSFQQHSLEDVTRSSMSIYGKTKKNVNGGSDPRFKKVISNSLQNNVCVGTEERSLKKTTIFLDKKDKKLVPFTWSPNQENNFNQSWDLSGFKKDDIKVMEGHNNGIEDCENLTATENVAEQPQDYLKAVDKLTFSHDLLVKSALKESLSTCTVNTTNTSLVSDEVLENGSNGLSKLPTATRVKKVQNWIQGQNTKPEKKQSVITVIGQTQGQDTLSSTLREIDKRKKLVKELDKYAMCKKIVGGDKGKEISDLMAKLISLTPSEKIGKENKGDENDVCCKIPCSRKDSGDVTETNGKLYNNIQNVDNDSVSPLSRKHSGSKKKEKKHQLAHDCLVKGKIQDFFNRMQYQWIFYVVFLISGILCWITYASLHKGSYVSFEFFSKKPKTMTWYEKICMWLWEFFRPSANYKRSTTWRPH